MYIHKYKLIPKQTEDEKKMKSQRRWGSEYIHKLRHVLQQ